MPIATQACCWRPKAAAAYAEAVRLNPDFTDARLHLGRMLAALGRPAEARTQFAEVLRLEPGNTDARQELAKLGGAGR